MVLHSVLYGLVITVLSCIFCYGTATACTELREVGSTFSQILIVEGKPNSISKASMRSCEKLNGAWVEALSTYDVVIGKNGIAQPHQKKEGDGSTPSGTFPIGELFGWSAAVDPVVQTFKSDYRYIVDARDVNGAYLDKFIDDPSSAYYNTWVSAPTTAKSYEQMRIDPYKYGLVVNYNMYPTVAGKGSAIFMHIWSGPDGSTAGCVALDETNLISVLQWLDKAKQPHIRIIPPGH